MQSYLTILGKILHEGTQKESRTGIDTLSLSGVMFEHDMREGFPLVTTKKVSLRNIAVELEFFLKGLTDKRWLPSPWAVIGTSPCTAIGIYRNILVFASFFLSPLSCIFAPAPPPSRGKVYVPAGTPLDCVSAYAP